jgi:hypothetical protein
MEKVYYIYYLHYGDEIPFYVGKTNNLTTRKNKHKTKYGPNIFIELLEESSTEEWRKLEEFYIQIFRYWGFVLENGFKGGGGASYWTKEQKNNKDRIKKLSIPKPEGFGEKIKNNRNHKQAGIKAGISNTNRGHYNQNSNRNKKISEKLKGRMVDWTGDSIIQLDLNGNFIQEWPSIRQAGFNLVGNQGESIRKCLKGLQKTAYGFTWKYK